MTAWRVPRIAIALVCALCTVRPGVALAQSLVTTLSAGADVARVDLESGRIERIHAGVAPWGMARGFDGRLYVSTAEGIAEIDLSERRRLRLIPYGEPVARLEFGEYRAGGMGLVAGADGRRLYVGLHRPARGDVLAVVDLEQGRVIAERPIGTRPFEVLRSHDGNEIYTIDHDSYSVSVIDTRSLAVRTIAVDPLGRGAFDKPHYAAIDARGNLWLPIQGRVLLRVDPASGNRESIEIHADTHQHGIALSSDGGALFIVGTGPAGRAGGGPNLTIFEPHGGRHRLLPLERPHERVIVDRQARHAVLSGGYTLPGGWDGLTVIDLQSGHTRRIEVPQRPLDLMWVEP